MTMWLEKDSRDVATWYISDPPTGPGVGLPTVEIGGTDYAMTVVTINPPPTRPNDPPTVKASIGVYGPNFSPQRAGEALVAEDTLARVFWDGISRSDEWIKLR